MFVLALPAGIWPTGCSRRRVFAMALLVGVAVGTGLAVLSESAVAPLQPLGRAP